MVLRGLTRTYVSIFSIVVPPAGGRNPLCPRIHFSTRSEVPHGFATFHAKRGSTRIYVSSFSVVEPPAGRRNPLCPRITFPREARFHMGLQPSTRSEVQPEPMCLVFR